MKWTAAAALLILVLPLEWTHAQPIISLRRIVNNWPTIELHFALRCNGQRLRVDDPKLVTVRENGDLIGDFTVWCPDTMLDCSMSAALVFDASGSMIGAKNAASKDAGHMFVNLMDGVLDEAALLWFNTTVRKVQTTTRDTALLHAAVSRLPASGLTAVWDAIIAGIDEMSNCTNPCRAVIALTDGLDNSSFHLPESCVSFARGTSIRVFTIGLGPEVNDSLLQYIADSTGGTYFKAPDAKDLASIYSSIIRILSGVDCRITYERRCTGSGSQQKTVQLSVNICGGADTATKSYTAPADTAGISTLDFQIGTRSQLADEDVFVPLELHTAVDDEFYPCTFAVRYDTSCIIFRDILTPPGTVFHGVRVYRDEQPGLVIFRTDSLLPVRTRSLPASLADLRFTARDPGGIDTVYCPVHLDWWSFSAGCLLARTKDGKINVVPAFACDLRLPDSLTVDQSGLDLAPNPFTVTYRVWNRSRHRATIAYVELRLPRGEGLMPAGSTPPIRQFNRVLEGGEMLTVDWIVYVQKQSGRRLLNITAVAYDDNGKPIQCGHALPIDGLRAELNCDASISRDWIELLTGRQPPPGNGWVVRADFHNTGSLPLSPLDVSIELADSTETSVQELDPTIPGNTLSRRIPVSFPHSTIPVFWFFRPTKAAADGVRHNLSYFVTARNRALPPGTVGCRIAMAILPITPHPQLECGLMAPDSIEFEPAGYRPSPFEARVRIRNTGTADAANLRVHVLQDTRFNILPPASQEYGTLAWGDSIGYWDPRNESFRLRVNPRQADGMDTVRIAVTADDAAAVFCEYPIRVARERRPAFSMSCTAEPERLDFDDRTNDYVPNPFTVSTVAVNNGDAPAEFCRLLFVGPPRFTPADDSPIITAGSGHMEPGDTVRHVWRLVPLRRSIGGWDTLVYQIQGSGGLGAHLVVQECRVPVYVPPARGANYSIRCDMPDSLRFDDVSENYIPDPFPLVARVTNTGMASGRGLTVNAMLPSGLIFAAGETQGKNIGDLQSGGTTELTWLLKPVSHTVPEGRDLPVLMRVADSVGLAAECESSVHVPPVTEATLSIHCGTEVPALTADRVHGRYAPNPFTVYAVVRNNGNTPAANVRVLCFPRSADLALLDPAERFVALRLDARGSSDTLRWNVYAAPRGHDDSVAFQFVVTADRLTTMDCATSVLVPALGQSMLACSLQSSMAGHGDTLRFDFPRGEYRDDESSRSATGSFGVFRARVRVGNAGDALATRVRATLLPPDGITLDMADSAMKLLGDIGPGGYADAEWRLAPERVAAHARRGITVVLSADNTAPARCVRDVIIEGAPKIVSIRLPEHTLGRSGEIVTVPIRIDTTSGRDIFLYKLHLRFNPDLLQFMDARVEGTFTALNWSGPRISLLRETGSDVAKDANVLRIVDFTTGSPLNSTHEGTLLFLRFRVVYDGGRASIATTVDSLRLLPRVLAIEDGIARQFESSMNSARDDSTDSNVRLILHDGVLTVSGDCLLPLSGGELYSLAQNKPNPFNPSTSIEFTLPSASPVRLAVYDAFGRELRVLMNEPKDAGKHTVNFHAEGLPSGMYIYRLTTLDRSEARGMILSR